MKRKARAGESTCHCGAYKFPHRFGGGDCNGQQMVDDYWVNHYGTGECEGCPHASVQQGNGCDVFDETESPKLCPVVQGFIQDNEIKPYWRTP